MTSEASKTFAGMWNGNSRSPSKEKKKVIDWPSRKREIFKPEVYHKNEPYHSMMFYYDLLPPRVRKALQRCKENFSTMKIYKLLLGGTTEDEIISRCIPDTHFDLDKRKDGSTPY